MTPFQGSLGTVVQINLKLLYAMTLAFGAYWQWPADPRWWGIGLVSICAGLGAVGLVIEAIKSAIKLLMREREIERFQAQGAKQRSARLMNDDDLLDAEMK